MTAPAQDIQQAAERFILTTLARRGPCTAAEIVQALSASHKPTAWFVFLSNLKTRRLVEHVVSRHSITYQLTRTGRTEAGL